MEDENAFGTRNVCPGISSSGGRGGSLVVNLGKEWRALLEKREEVSQGGTSCP